MQKRYTLGQRSLISVEMLDRISGFAVQQLPVLLYVNLSEDSHVSMGPLPQDYLMKEWTLF